MKSRKKTLKTGWQRAPRVLQRTWILLLALAMAGGAMVGCSEDDGIVLVDGKDRNQHGDLVVDESGIVAVRDGDSLAVEIAVESRIGAAARGEVEVALRDLDGNLIDNVKNSFSLEENGIGIASVTLSGLDPELETGDLANYVLHYRLRSFRADLYGRRSVFSAVKKREVHVLSPDTFYANAPGGLRVIAREPVTGAPLANASVDAFIEITDPDDSEKTILEPLFESKTDEFGVLAATFSTPDLVTSGNLVLRVSNELGEETIVRPIDVIRSDKILLTTDKPLYQPGQTIHLRALALSRPAGTPAADKPVLFEIRDGKGNKIFKEEGTTNDFGVASADFKLARELNMGDFEIDATIGDANTEKTVRVERYVLPKFKVDLDTNRSWYRPGTTLTGDVSGDYLFGKPVSGGEVTVTASQFDVGFNIFAELTGNLDEQGNYEFSVELPDYFTGGGLDQATSFVQLDITVVDATGHEQTISRQITVAEGQLVLNAIPQTNLIPNRPATLFVMATDPNGFPLTTEVELRGEGLQLGAMTNQLGIARLEFTVPDRQELELTLVAEDQGGNAVQKPLNFDLSNTDQGAIALITNKPTYKVGDIARLSIFTNEGVRRAFVDVIRDGQTLLTSAVDVQNGIATYEYPIDVSSSGTVHFEVYYASGAGNIVRARKLAFIEAADDLAIKASMDQEEYRPGEPATIDLSVSDGTGNGVQAAIGVSIVDEAVFALQEMQPGLAKIFFRIEEELMQPKVNIYNFSARDLVEGPDSDPAQEELRQDAAEAFMASIEDTSPYPITVNTLVEAQKRSLELVKPAVEADSARIVERLGQILDMGIFTEENAMSLAASVDGDFADLWGGTYQVTATDDWTIQIVSSGPDEVRGTADDVELTVNTWSVRQSLRGGGQDDLFDNDGGFEGQPGPPNADGGQDPAVDESGEKAGDDSPRVRKYFPETLYFNPALITDADGNAQIEIPMADSITTWRMTSMASGRTGQLGSGTSAIRVFQPFFIDIDFPVSLTQNDEIAVPVALFNYLEEPQTVTLQVEDVGEPWYTLLDSAEKTVELGAGEVSVIHFRVRVDEVGRHPFQVTAIGSQMSDAIERRIQVLPDGKEFPVSVSGRLDGDIAETVNIPADAIDGGSSLVVKIYPGMFSQVVEGLDSLLQMPSGCFEQTSSTTYPNVLALTYMTETGQVTPEIELKAREYISLGYQRLVSYESPSGGFEWFGNDPGHRILTAYGLLQYTDMAVVHDVDEAMVARTQGWLASQQESDGRFKAAPEGIHEGATNNFQDSDLRATAYITYALLYSGYNGPEMNKAVSWLRQNEADAEDSYSLAVLASALLLADKTDPVAGRVINRLVDAAESGPGRSGTITWWESESQSLYYSTGETMNMETTAMAILALIEAGTHPTVVEQSINYLIENKDSFGNWSSTQATILSLRAFIALLDKSTENVNATVDVFAAGQLVDTITVNASNSDVLQQVDLKPYTVNGANDIQLQINGEGSLLFQITGRYYLPWSEDIIDPAEVLDVEVSYDRTQLSVNDTVTATATVSNNTGLRQDMVMVDLGIPPGFDVLTKPLQDAVDAGQISRFEMTGRTVTVYLYGLDGMASETFQYQLQARMPLEAQTPSSSAWLYYDPAVSAEAEPVTFIVQ